MLVVVVVASMLCCVVGNVGRGGVVVRMVVVAAVVVGSVVVVGAGAGIAVDGGMANVGPWIVLGGSRGTVPKPAPLPSRYTSRV